MNEPEMVEGRSLNELPDEILILIFNRLIHLKCLCSCSLVSARFSHLILLHVSNVSFTAPSRLPTTVPDDNLPKKLLRFVLHGIVSKPFQYLRQFVESPLHKPLPPMISSFYGDSFRSAIYFLSKFKAIRSLQIILPSSPHHVASCIGRNDDESLCKWTAKFGPTIDTFVFLSSTSVRVGQSQFDAVEERAQGSQQEFFTNELLKHRVHLAFQCLKDAIVRHRMLLFFIEEHSRLESISITDSKKKGMLLLKGGKLIEMKHWIRSASEEVKSKLKQIEVPVTALQWQVPILKLPVSGQVMEGATLVLMEMVDRRHVHGRDSGFADDVTVIRDVFDEGEEVFGEAVVEMMLNHKSRIMTLL